MPRLPTGKVRMRYRIVFYLACSTSIKSCKALAEDLPQDHLESYFHWNSEPMSLDDILNPPTHAQSPSFPNDVFTATTDLDRQKHHSSLFEPDPNHRHDIPMAHEGSVTSSASFTSHLVHCENPPREPQLEEATSSGNHMISQNQATPVSQFSDLMNSGTRSLLTTVLKRKRIDPPDYLSVPPSASRLRSQFHQMSDATEIRPVLQNDPILEFNLHEGSNPTVHSSHQTLVSSTQPEGWRMAANPSFKAIQTPTTSRNSIDGSTEEAEIFRGKCLPELKFDISAFFQERETSREEFEKNWPEISRIFNKFPVDRMIIEENGLQEFYGLLPDMTKNPGVEVRDIRYSTRLTLMRDKKNLLLFNRNIWYVYWEKQSDIDFIKLSRKIISRSLKSLLPVFIFYVDMINTIIPRPNQIGEHDHKSELKLALESFVELGSTLHRGRIFNENSERIPNQADKFSREVAAQVSFDHLKYAGGSAFGSTLWKFLEFWMRRHRSSLIDKNSDQKKDFNRTGKSLFNSIFCFTIENLTERLIKAD
ncbi:hypothetical protein MJO28_003782 [Puccinia striiformis f. sp. tritici]|nr:hypothetical protein Pst134EA_007603 [Puccinia striiformis f. sp. tritici]KAI9611054.1 hypothetical protein H4Q26_008901 [Puccinia striiformis f. sp. tritici PST-130]KNE94087.1 hypothetical protein PSTG_12517 [Puccinia striiformis f. sp. tritici PST-78]POW02950.1 hypothetical protein PSHT_11883 [Puccinia striiformis]KAH9460541.1 hypothetical protein Pst134EB_008713 [Puccinia striiformis f. sp. tritici]KAH9470337.1 hypothetical protein Pst134EA_007603 [Puccinia striiformis f. sp. tritici]